jgi:hypothetical protein
MLTICYLCIGLGGAIGAHKGEKVTFVSVSGFIAMCFISPLLMLVKFGIKFTEL